MRHFLAFVFLALLLWPLLALGQEPAVPMTPDELGSALWQMSWSYLLPAGGTGVVGWAAFRVIVRTVVTEFRQEAEKHVEALAAVVRTEAHKALAECPPIRVVVVEAEEEGVRLVRTKTQ